MPRFGFLQRRHLRRRRRKRRAQQIFQQPFAAEHRRGPRSVRRQRQNRSLRHDAAALAVLQAHALERLTVDSLDPVVPRQRTIQERKLPVDEFQNAAVLAHHRRHEHQRFAAHRIQQFIVHRGEALRIGLLAIQQAKIQPLRGEVVRQGVGLGVVEHPPHLRFENTRLPQCAPVCRLQQRVVRHAAPQKIREPRRQLMIVQPVRARHSRRIAFDAEQEIGRHQHGLQADAHPFFQAVAVFLRQRHQLHQRLQLAFGGRPAVRTVRQILHHAARALRIVSARSVAANEDPRIACGAARVKARRVPRYPCNRRRSCGAHRD